MVKQPVTVGIAAYNAEKNISKLLKSLLRDPYHLRAIETLNAFVKHPA